jgi:hypothetical protein
VLGALYALVSLYVGYLFVASAVGPRLSEKDFVLQVAPFLGGLGLAVLAIPLIWNCVRLAVSRDWKES